MHSINKQIINEFFLPFIKNSWLNRYQSDAINAQKAHKQWNYAQKSHKQRNYVQKSHQQWNYAQKSHHNEIMPKRHISNEIMPKSHIELGLWRKLHVKFWTWDWNISPQVHFEQIPIVNTCLVTSSWSRETTVNLTFEKNCLSNFGLWLKISRLRNILMENHYQIWDQWPQIDLERPHLKANLKKSVPAINKQTNKQTKPQTDFPSVLIY